MYVHVRSSTCSCVYEQCMYTDYDSLPNCSGDEDVFGDASHGKARTKYGPSTDAQEKKENFDLSVGLTVDTWELLSCE